MTLFANDKIRVCYFVKMTEKPEAVFTNSNPAMAARSGVGKLTMPDNEKGLQTFTRSNSYRQDLITVFSEEFKDMDTYAILFEAR